MQKQRSIGQRRRVCSRIFSYYVAPKLLLALKHTIYAAESSQFFGSVLEYRGEDDTLSGY